MRLSDISTTMRYMHLAPAHDREAIALLDRGKARAPGAASCAVFVAKRSD